MVLLDSRDDTRMKGSPSSHSWYLRLFLQHRWKIRYQLDAAQAMESPMQAVSVLFAQYFRVFLEDIITWKTPDSPWQCHRKPTYRWNNAPDRRQENTVENVPHSTSFWGFPCTWDTSLTVLEILEGSLSLRSSHCNTYCRREDTSVSGYQLIQGCGSIYQDSYTRGWPVLDSLFQADL